MNPPVSLQSSRSPLVVKLGGSALADSRPILADVGALWHAGHQVVVVHGGGPTVTDWLSRLGIEATFKRGLRVTTPEALDVVIAVLAGLINKQLVGSLLQTDIRAVGLSGVDGALIQAHVSDSSLGQVGEIEAIDTAVIESLLSHGFLPVVATSAVNMSKDAGGPLLNVNADSAAARIAAALGADALIYLSDIPGVLDAEGQLIPHLSGREAKDLLSGETITGGMIPKLESMLDALDRVGTVHILDGRQPGALASVLTESPQGTVILGES